ncbi:Os03g0430575 [Oryza sativa Japonica Group]|uniref:Os03g0430575 protein n=1 Tax=Oryza sativa subsp. japonica TaxID=39947 RepID=A0A0P0VZR6_ORYSJ|nr:hypothetical protein EE612_018255 [Oryza sativa]BAS84813.1 Os03g0430575 [Oryza sativa Japonica Group]
MSYTRPGSAALAGLMWPAPVRNAVALSWCSSRIGLPAPSTASDVVRMADLMAAGNQSGWRLLTSAATPLACGVAMDVPDMTLKSPPPPPPPPCWRCGGHAARMLSPGARTSGLSTPGATLLGPRDEKEATVGAGWTLSNVLSNTTVALGLQPPADDDDDLAYSVMLWPPATVTCTMPGP